MTEARIGVDVGGTFTDVAAVRDGELVVAKTPSTPDAPQEGVIDGLDAALDRAGVRPADVAFLGHGTTVATNAVLERDWAEVALLTTEGFRDALEIGRQDRPDLYDLGAEKPTPVVARDRRYGVPERLDERGAVLEPLDTDAVREVAADLDAGSVAISFLFAFENPDHERRARDLLVEEGVDAPISLSSEVRPEIREYERTLATALNAALRPVVDRYVAALADRIDERGITAPLRIMGSDGGLMTADATRERPVNTLLSGPAAGVQGAAHVAGLAGIDDAITMDMGGTSCDVSLVRGGEPATTTEQEVGGYPVNAPAVDVHTIGAGGGSIAWLDAGDALRVGPRSAGADPGPICYGRGGTEPTVTDAHLVLGRIDPSTFGADFDVDPEAVRAGIREHVADPLGRDVEAAARGILDVANASMERALRVVSVERGHDPRGLALVAFGGAGPLHAPALAAELDVPRVLVPRSAGVLSALGLLASDVSTEYSTSRVRPWAEVDPAALEETFAGFEARAEERLAAEGVPEADRRYERALDVRYAGQSFDLTVAADGDLDAVAERFHAAHERRYGHASPDEPLELVTVRLRARGLVEAPDLAVPDPGGTVEDAVRETRAVDFEGRARETRVYERDRLPVGGEVDGPAIVEGRESTTAVPPAGSAGIDEYGNVVVEVP